MDVCFTPKAHMLSVGIDVSKCHERRLELPAEFGTGRANIG